MPKVARTVSSGGPSPAPNPRDCLSLEPPSPPAVLAAVGNLHKLLRYGLGLLAFLVFAGSHAYGQEVTNHATLTICNKGSERIFVVVALRDDLWPVVNSWEVSGWTSIAPGHCEVVYRESLSPAYIGFAFTDSQNHLSAGHIEQAPDFGWNGFTRVLTKADKRLFFFKQKTAYEIRNGP